MTVNKTMNLMDSKPLLLSHDSDGGLRISIGKQEYTYVLPKDKLEEMLRLFKHRPWRALHFIKLNFKYYRKES
jgi:hypothetical protein